MTKTRLLAALSALGLAVVGGVIYLGVDNPDCLETSRTCQALVDGVMGQREVRVFDCALEDGGRTIVWPDDVSTYVLDKDAWCHVPTSCSACDGGDLLASTVDAPAADYPCACARTDAGECKRLNADGSDAGDAPTGTTLEAGRWTGPGCFRRSCFDMSAGDGWPSECPQ